LGQLKHNVEVVDGLMDIKKFDDVYAFKFFVDLYLGVESSFSVLILIDFGLVDYFDGYFFLGLLVDALEDLRKRSKAKLHAQKYHVLAYPFFRVVAHPAK